MIIKKPYLLILSAIINIILLGTMSVFISACSVNPESQTTTEYMEIYSFEDLERFSQRVNSGEIYLNANLMNDINCENQILKPIGTSKYPYSGTFSGNSMTVKNIVVSENSNLKSILAKLKISSDMHTGMFGYVSESGKIHSVIIDNITVSGSKKTGVAVCVNSGEISDVTIKNSSVSGICGINRGALSNSYCVYKFEVLYEDKIYTLYSKEDGKFDSSEIDDILDVIYTKHLTDETGNIIYADFYNDIISNDFYGKAYSIAEINTILVNTKNMQIDDYNIIISDTESVTDEYVQEYLDNLSIKIFNEILDYRYTIHKVHSVVDVEFEFIDDIGKVIFKGTLMFASDDELMEIPDGEIPITHSGDSEKSTVGKALYSAIENGSIKITLKAGEAYKINPLILSVCGLHGKFYYKSSAEDIASVSKSGNITAVSSGEAEITVTASKGSHIDFKIIVT